MGLLEALKQFASDAAGGSLNPEVGNTLSGLLNYGKDRAKYIGGLLDDSSPINKDFKNWHDRTQLGLADLIAGKEGPQADYGYSQIMNMAGVAPLGITAWHGSPYKFDKFSLDKIGTGEGKTQQGVGGYLSETESIGQKYADRLADMHGKTSGYLYKTDLPEEAISKFANYDKPLSENPQSVQDAIRKLTTDDVMHNLHGYYGWEDINSAPVAAIMGALDVTNGNARNVTSEAFKKAGIPGIRYLDGGSRGTGTGTSNFVVFDPELIRILERNGQPTGLEPWKPGEYRLGDLLK